MERVGGIEMVDYIQWFRRVGVFLESFSLKCLHYYLTYFIDAILHFQMNTPLSLPFCTMNFSLPCKPL